MAECNKAEQWLLDRKQQQELMPKTADPVLRSSEIKKKTNTLDAYISLSLSVSLPPLCSKDAYVFRFTNFFKQLNLILKEYHVKNFASSNANYM